MNTAWNGDRQGPGLWVGNDTSDWELRQIGRKGRRRPMFDATGAVVDGMDLGF